MSYVYAKLQPPAHAGYSLADFSTLKMKTIRSSEMSVHTRSTRFHIPDDGILQDCNCFAMYEFYKYVGVSQFNISSVNYAIMQIPLHGHIRDIALTLVGNLGERPFGHSR
jgi:hypothetical protein